MSAEQRTAGGVLLRADARVVATAAARLLDRAAAGHGGLLAAVVSPPALVLGSAQPVATVDAEACARRGVEVTRRGSGGGAVLCDETLLEVDVALPPGHPLAVDDVTESYRWLGLAWQSALSGLGVTTRLVAVDDARAASAERRAAARLACWAGLSPYELVTADGGKLVGLSQRRRAGATLIQCGISTSGHPARVLDLLRLSDATRAAAAAALAGASALDELGLAIGPAELWGTVGPVLAAALDAPPPRRA